MVDHLWRLDVQRAFGSAIAMIPDVRVQSCLENFHSLVPHLAMRRVLHLKMVTQCAMLEDFGIFLVLADKASCITYYLKDY
jgi:hypothetical protein